MLLGTLTDAASLQGVSMLRQWMLIFVHWLQSVKILFFVHSLISGTKVEPFLVTWKQWVYKWTYKSWFSQCTSMGIGWLRLCKGFRERGEWGPKVQGASSMGPKRPGSREQGAKESNLGTREQKTLGFVSKNLTRFLGFFWYLFCFPPTVHHIFWPIPTS